MDSSRKAIIIAVISIYVLAAIVGCTGSGSSSKRKWSDLSETEKNNARWANQARQYIQSR